MKIKFTKKSLYSNRVYQPGEIAEMPGNWARLYLKALKAVIVETPKQTFFQRLDAAAKAKVVAVTEPTDEIVTVPDVPETEVAAPEVPALPAEVDYASLTYRDLQRMLAGKGVSVVGKKSDLLARLKGTKGIGI